MGFRRPCSTYTDFVLNFQLLLDNAHFFVSPKVDFVFSGPHPLGFKVCELKTLLIDNMLATVLCFAWNKSTAWMARHHVSDLPD
jgi:hypothetical protein